MSVIRWTLDVVGALDVVGVLARSFSSLSLQKRHFDTPGRGGNLSLESHLTRQIVVYICHHLILAVWLVACLGIEAPRVSVDFTTEGAIRVTCAKSKGEEEG